MASNNIRVGINGVGQIRKEYLVAYRNIPVLKSSQSQVETSNVPNKFPWIMRPSFGHTFQATS